VLGRPEPRSSGRFRLAQIQAKLEEAAEILAGQTRLFDAGPVRDHTHDLDAVVTRAVAAGVAFGLAEGTETTHDRTLSSPPDGSAPPKRGVR
jgi:hypothetical protein